MEKIVNIGKGQFKAWSFATKNVVFATIIVAVLILIFKPSMAICAWILFPAWLLSAMMFFSPKQVFKVHVFGETLEGLTSLGQGLAKKINKDEPDGGEPATKKKPTGPFSNATTDGFLSLVKNVFLFQTVLFLALPLYVNYTEGGLTLGIFVLMVVVVVALAMWRVFEFLSKIGIVLLVLLYSVGISSVLFPQIGFYSGKLFGDTHPVDRRVAKTENEIKAVSEENKTVRQLAARNAVLEELKTKKITLEELKKQLEEQVKSGK